MSSRTLTAALRYFTILPLGRGDDDAAPGPQLFAYLAPIGGALGAIAGAAAFGVGLIAPHAMAVAVAFGLSIALTGALHVDGFLDSCDALFASVTPQRRLEILKDPRHGTFAIASFAVLCAMWLAALGAIPLAHMALVLAYAGATGRWCALLNAPLYAYRNARAPVVALAIEGSLLAALSIWTTPYAWIALVAGGAISLAVGRSAKIRLGGVLTGDVYGALAVGLEVLALAVCAAGA